MKKRLLTLILAVVLAACPRASWALEEDFVLIADGDYFSVYGPADLDVGGLLYKLNYSYFLQDVSFLSEGEDDLNGLLAKTMDALYLEASDILGIHVYSFDGKLEIYPDKAAMNSFLGTYLHRTLTESSYYLHEKATIYINDDDLTLGMLGHEIAHAIISSYFVVLPPPKVQEILSGYVEYGLRKQVNTLP